MAATFFWYDLETSGTNAIDDRILQFAGQRTDADLNQLGSPLISSSSRQKMRYLIQGQWQ